MTQTAPQNIAKGLSQSSQATVEQSLYEIRKKIHPRAVSGWFAGWRVSLVMITQLVFYGAVWLQWNGRQAVLFDLSARKFYVFGLVLWPQDFIYLAVLLIVSALSLFLFTAVAGRLWCGYACPQTVYTEIFLWIERRIEGDRSARQRLDAAPLGVAKIVKQTAKHGLWLLLALWTGFTFVGYFTPIRELGASVVGGGGWEIFWILFYAFATYGNAGWMREQVCKYMCPYARFQSAMFDRDTMIITYDRERGDPRGGRARNVDPKALELGDCVDCGICVQACPTGIDIRNGLQYECIGCAACVDGCNQVMDRMGYRRGLIRYSTENALREGWDFKRMLQRVFRPRIVVYTTILWGVIAAAGISLWTRTPIKLDVIRDRGALSREVENGQIENIYRLQVMNTEESVRSLRLDVSGVTGITIQGRNTIEMKSASTMMIPVRVSVPAEVLSQGVHHIEFRVEALDNPAVHVQERTVFLVR